VAGAPAKINLGLVVGPLRNDGKHEVATVLQRIDLRDDLALEPGVAGEVVVDGFEEDTLVRAALETLTRESGADTGWRVRLDKRIPVAAGLGGGSSDAATALELANELLPRSLTPDELHAIAGRIGADVPFFLTDGTQLGTGDGTDLTPIAAPLDYTVVLVLADGERKSSTAEVYRRFDERAGHGGFAERRAELADRAERLHDPHDLAALPRNDLVSSPLTGELESRGAFRADVSGAGPVVYGLFERAEDAAGAAGALEQAGRTWLCRPVGGR